jgi:two-component system nitrate/nitrite response regulator NarL
LDDRRVIRTTGRSPDGGAAAASQPCTLTVAPVSFTVQPSPLRHHSGMPPPRVRVVVADDHPLFREGIERAVRGRPELELVGAAAEGREALTTIRDLEPHVAVLDLRLPGLDGLQILNAVVRDGMASRVLFLSASGDPELVYRAVQMGAAGYFRKEADREAILDAIAAVARGSTVIDPELQAGVFEQVRLRGTGDDRPILSAREREVLSVMAEGLTGPQIAERLIVALPTVKTYQARLYEKLGVSERAAAVAEAMRRGLLE